MAITENELKKEKTILKKVNLLLDKTINELGKDVYQGEEDLIEFKKMMWENANIFDSGEEQQVMLQTSKEENRYLEKQKYFRKLKSIEKKPYFASIVFKDDENNIYNIYMSLTYLKDTDENNILYDWRSPICSLFYDYETGPCSYQAPGGTYSGELKRKRQYKIEDKKLIGVFDNSLNINDEVLQEVLATESSEKMKNVVNTIQQEQNKVIRNLEDNNLIVQGIAGSGKTTVALHRIAFLLYRLKNLNSNNILIFSPNNIFADYISDVLPSLGEANTLQTTFADYLESFLTEYTQVESFTDFVSRYYSYKETFPELVEYKQSDQIMKDLDNFLDEYINNCYFTKSFKEGEKNYIDKNEINNMLHHKYDRLPLFERVEEISLKLCSNFYKGKTNKQKTYIKLLYKNSNFEKNYIEILKKFFKSKYTKFQLNDKTLEKYFTNEKINYEDALIYAYIKGKLEGFIYEGTIKQVVIDEAQDYNKMQYYIITQIFKKDTKYIELLKTYRSSPEIIDYTNKILNLNHVNAIRNKTNKPVIIRKGVLNLKERLIEDLNHLQSIYKSTALITKDIKAANELYELLKDETDIDLVEVNTKVFHKECIIIPAYLSKGLEFDSVIIYNDRKNTYKKDERNLLYVACTRCQHELYIYN